MKNINYLYIPSLDDQKHIDNNGAIISSNRSEMQIKPLVKTNLTCSIPQYLLATQNRSLKLGEGDSIVLWGKYLKLHLRYPALVHRAEPSGDQLIVSLHSNTQASVEKLLKDMYRRELTEAISKLWEECQQLVGVCAQEWHIKDMRTRWGSCNTRHKRIWIRLDIVHYPPICLRMVLIHELIHIHYPHHDNDFYATMDKFMPDWREAKRLLMAPPGQALV